MPTRCLPSAVALLASLLLVSANLASNSNREPPDPAKPKFPSARECAANMAVPKGFVVKPFASEPDIVNPIAIDFDARGRVWVLECLEYPQKAPKDRKGRDRIKVLEDTDGDGVADKVTTFADGLNLATGMAVGFAGSLSARRRSLSFSKIPTATTRRTSERSCSTAGATRTPTKP